VIRWCWSKANILPTPLQADLENHVDCGVTQDQAALDLATLLKDTHLDKQRAVIEDLECDGLEDVNTAAAGIVDAIANFDADEFIFEGDIPCEEVLASIQVANDAVDSSDSDGGVDDVQPPSPEEAKECCLHLLGYLEARGMNTKIRPVLDSMLQDIATHRVESLKQSTLHDCIFEI
jgi:hypothetical protein